MLWQAGSRNGRCGGGCRGGLAAPGPAAGLALPPGFR